MTSRKTRVSASDITGAIFVIRGTRVLLNNELASLYSVTIKALNQAVKRNAGRFPKDFMFRLNQAEAESINRSQIVTGSQRHRDARFPPAAFTEHGAIMAAAVLNSARAVDTSVLVVRAFVQMRALLVSNAALARKVDELDRKYGQHDKAITVILTTIGDLTNPPPPKRRGIGFNADLGGKT